MIWQNPQLPITPRLSLSKMKSFNYAGLSTSETDLLNNPGRLAYTFPGERMKDVRTLLSSYP